jgi:hypothetical protein
MSNTTPEATSLWLTRPQACRVLGIGARAFNTLVESGALTYRHVPGSRGKVLRTEVEQLVERSTRPVRRGVTQ